MKFPKETWDKNTCARARARTHTHTHIYIYIYSFINCLDKKHGYLWVNLELKYEGLGYNNFFKHLDLSVSRPPSFEILAPSLMAVVIYIIMHGTISRDEIVSYLLRNQYQTNMC